MILAKTYLQKQVGKKSGKSRSLWSLSDGIYCKFYDSQLYIYMDDEETMEMPQEMPVDNRGEIPYFTSGSVDPGT